MIRKMVVEDLDRIEEIEKECFTSIYKREHFEYEINDNMCAFLYVLEEEGKIIGLLDFWVTFDCCQLVRIAICKDAQGNGKANLLMDFLIEESIKHECETILLEVRVSNEIAIEMYEKYDFLEINVRKRYYSDNGEDALVMGKVIGGLV